MHKRVLNHQNLAEEIFDAVSDGFDDEEYRIDEIERLESLLDRADSELLIVIRTLVDRIEDLLFINSTDNTEINYLYRDAANFKLYTSIVIPGVLSKEQEGVIRSCLFDGEWFVPAQVGLPDDNKYSDSEDDHPLFEWTGIKHVQKPVSNGLEHLTPDVLVKRFLDAQNNWELSS